MADDDIFTGSVNKDYPLIATDVEGGPFESESFIAGSQFGMFDILAAMEVPVITGLIDERLVTQTDLLAMAYGYLARYDYATNVDGAVMVVLYRSELDEEAGIPDSLPLD